MSNTLTGCKLDTYTIHEQIGQGSFGSVYRASASDKTVVAIKVAKEHVNNSKRQFSTKALALFSGGFGEVTPVPEQLLKIQSGMSSLAPDILPDTSEPFTAGTTSYLVMEYLKGMTLRQLLNQNLEAGGQRFNEWDLAIKVAHAFAALENSNLKYHGDLKPENIILSGTGVRIVDPGYYGSLPCREGMIPRAVVTTPAYYPRLQPDDYFAAGCILWEILVGLHPIVRESDRSVSGTLPKQTGTQLRKTIAYEEMIGQYFFSPLQYLPLPRELFSKIPEQIETLLLSVIGLQLKDEGIELISSRPRMQNILNLLISMKKSGSADGKFQSIERPRLFNGM